MHVHVQFNNIKFGKQIQMKNYDHFAVHCAKLYVHFLPVYTQP